MHSGATPLPIDEVLPELRRALASAPSAVLSAPTGSGKTTRVPLALLDEPWMGERGRLLVLEPRRVAARAAARHMARLLGEPAGARVGFATRFERRIGPTTRIEVITEGVLTRRLQRDPELAGVAGIVFDETHERSLETDLGLALSLDVQRSLRPQLRLLAMSATLDVDALCTLLGGAPAVHGRVPAHPLEVRYCARGRGVRLERAVAREVLALGESGPGDVLAFLPGRAEIRRVGAALEAAHPALVVCPLHGELAAGEQDRAIRPDPQRRRRVVLATNIAESSLTVDGIRAVVDSGLARRPRFDPNTGLTRLETVRISRASATQRAGRAARQGPGVCVRLWSAEEHARRPAHDPPAIRVSDLARLALELAAWGIDDAASLPWLEPPPVPALERARSLLVELGALDGERRLTPLGRAMSALPAHPRLAAILASDDDASAIGLACDLAALMEAPDVAPDPGAPSASDLHERVSALRLWRRSAGERRGPSPFRTIDRAARQLRRRLGANGDAVGDSDEHATGRMLLAGYPDRVAQRRDGAAGRFLLASGRGVVLPGDDALARRDYLVVPDLDAGRVEGRCHRAAAVELCAIESVLAARIGVREIVAWDARERRVVARRESRLGALTLRSREIESPPPDALRAAMLDGVRAMGIASLPWNDRARTLQARIESLRRWCPEAGWPRVDDATLAEDLEHWLAPLLAGVRSADRLRELDLFQALLAALPPRLRPELERLAPTHVEVPSGSRVRLRYSPPGPPVLAVKLQEMFGQQETPTVCDGRVPVLVHLLSPAARPVQVTQDLAGFWRRGYEAVRRELKGRYPRHPWPDDPLAAEPTRRAAPRRAKRGRR